MASSRTWEPDSLRCFAIAGMVVRTSSWNSATNALGHTHRKLEVMLTHTLHPHVQKSLDGCEANFRIRILQRFSDVASGWPDILLNVFTQIR